MSSFTASADGLFTVTIGVNYVADYRMFTCTGTVSVCLSLFCSTVIIITGALLMTPALAVFLYSIMVQTPGRLHHKSLEKMLHRKSTKELHLSALWGGVSII